MIESREVQTSETTGQWVRRLGLLLGPITFFAILSLLDLAPESPEVTSMAAVAAWVSIWWITEAVPLPVTSLLPVVLFPVCGIMSGKEVASKYFHDLILLFLGGFLIAIALEQWRLHKRFALVALSKTGTKRSMILLGFMLSTAILSMWISNTATAMMMIPLVTAVLSQISDGTDESFKSYESALLLGVAYAASIGGVATYIGTPPNVVFAAVYEQQFSDHEQIGFGQWMLLGVPLSAILLSIAFFLLCFVARNSLKGKDIHRDFFRNEVKKLGVMTRNERLVAGVFILTAFLWITRSGISAGDFQIPGWKNLFGNPGFLTDGTVAIAMAILLFLLPARNSEGQGLLDSTAFRKVPWDVLLLFGGGLALAAGFKETGLSLWLGSRLEGITDLHPLLLMGMICLLVTFLTEVTSNTATATVLLPVFAGNAQALGIDPLVLMVPAALSCSFAFMLPVSTPPNAIVFGTGKLKISTMAGTGVILNLIGVLVTILVLYLLGGAILGIDWSVSSS